MYRLRVTFVKTYFERKLVIWFTLVALLALAVGGFAHYTARGLIRNTKLVSHTHAVLQDLLRIQSLCQDIQSGQRGFLLTGDDAFMNQRTAAMASMEEELKKLHELTADNPSQQQRISELESRIAAYIQHSDSLIEIRREAGWKRPPGRLPPEVVRK